MGSELKLLKTPFRAQPFFSRKPHAGSEWINDRGESANRLRPDYLHSVRYGKLERTK
jgi:hypothetical protein